MNDAIAMRIVDALREDGAIDIEVNVDPMLSDDKAPPTIIVKAKYYHPRRPPMTLMAAKEQSGQQPTDGGKSERPLGASPDLRYWSSR